MIKELKYVRLRPRMSKATIKTIILSSLILYSASFFQEATAHKYYIEPGGEVNAVKTAIESLVAGDTLYVKIGIYEIDDIINVRHSGNRNHRICVFGYDDEPGKKPTVNPIFDFSKQPHTGDETAKQFRGVLQNPNADYWYWRDIDITKAADNGMKLEASYCVIERCNFYRCGDTGLQLGFDASGNGSNLRNPKFLYGRYNMIINCDSYYNYDVQAHGGNSDGFANKNYPGPGNEWHGDRCWANSDDGWDLSYSIYPCLIDNCWAIYNGYLEDGSIGIDGNGFKLGGHEQSSGSDCSYGAHIFTNCVAAHNLCHGFDQDNHNEGTWLLNCTAFSNKLVNFRFNCDVDMIDNTVFHLRNCLGFRPGESNHRFGDMSPDSEFTSWQDLLGVSPQYNMGKGTDPKTGQEYKRISAKDWPNYDDQFEDISKETAIGPRQANGELPLNFARPKVGSIFEDKGTPIENFYCKDIFKDDYYKNTDKWLDDYSATITLPYYGSAPDYGAYEAGWERPAYELTTLPVNDGTLPDVEELTAVGDKHYQKTLLINDYLFQDATLSDEVSQCIVDAAATNILDANYYGKDGIYPYKPGNLYGGATKGAYMLANTNGYIEFSVPSLSEMHSNCYGGGKDATMQIQWKRPDESSWHDGESIVIDQCVTPVDFTAYGIPQSVDPIIVRVNSTGSNDIYLTDLTLNGFEEYVDEVVTAVHTPFAGEENGIYFTSNGIIAYGDIACIKIYDASGAQVAGSALSQFCNVASLGQGLYTAVIIAKDGTKTMKKFTRQ